MKRKILSAIIYMVLLCTYTKGFSQNVGINTTGNRPDTSAMLDVASTTKGMLAPRMTTAQRTAIYSPANSLLVYDTDLSGFYYYKGSAWVKMESASDFRTNYVLVKSATDFPAAVSGIINLAVNTVYEINGTITLTNMINLNGTRIMGIDRDNDVLLYTGSGSLFTGSYGGHVQGVALSATTSGAKVFNLNNTNGTDHLIVGQCLINNSDNVGLIKGFLSVEMYQIDYNNNNNGITYESITYLSLPFLTWNDTNKGTYEKFAGTFETIQKSGGISDDLAANAATAIDVTGVVSITNKASLNDVVFIGDGTYVNGAFSKYWAVHSFGIPIEADEVASANLYISTAATTTFSAVNTPVKISGTTTSANLYRTTSPANNMLTYTGTRTRTFKVSCSLTAITSSVNETYSFYIYKNGAKLPESKQTFKLASNADQASANISCIVSLASNDYIEAWVENNTDANSMTVQTLNMSIN